MPVSVLFIYFGISALFVIVPAKDRQEGQRERGDMQQMAWGWNHKVLVVPGELQGAPILVSFLHLVIT